MKRFIVTGGAGFIGSAVARHLISDTTSEVCVIDKLTYAGNTANFAEAADSDRFRFEQADICDAAEMERIFNEFKPIIVQFWEDSIKTFGPVSNVRLARKYLKDIINNDGKSAYERLVRSSETYVSASK